jgi:ABC-type nitrate/sulfonate/bicarbonate transport system permease component
VSATRLLRFVGRRLELPLALLLLGIAWQLLSLHVNNTTLVPRPLAVLAAWRDMLGDDLPDDILASLVHLGAGYGLGAAFGFALALLCARFAAVEAIADPVMELLRPIGAIAWIPIAILMFGVGALVPIFLIFYAALFPIFINTLAGIKQVDPSLINAARMLGASRRMVVSHVVLPAALPAVLAGARLSLGVSWAAMAAAELVGSDAGLGWRVFWYQEFFAMDRVMAVILTIGVLGFLVDAGLRALQATLMRWRPAAAAERA